MYNTTRLLDSDAMTKLTAQIMAPSRDVARQPNLLTRIPETEPVKNTSAMAREPIQAEKKAQEIFCSFLRFRLQIKM